jgi:hypothetical protein
MADRDKQQERVREVLQEKREEDQAEAEREQPTRVDPQQDEPDPPDKSNQ